MSGFLVVLVSLFELPFLNVYITAADIGQYLLPLLKLLLISVLLFSFYNYFVRKRISGNTADSESKNIQIDLLKDKKLNPAFISLIVRNTGSGEVNLNTPELVFRRWGKKRKFRILSVGNSDVLPNLFKKGSISAVNIELEQFYQYAPDLRESHRVSVEIQEETGVKFISRSVRLKWI